MNIKFILLWLLVVLNAIYLYDTELGFFGVVIPLAIVILYEVHIKSIENKLKIHLENVMKHVRYNIEKLPKKDNKED